MKILTQGYQAESVGSSGLQITAVTKSGTTSFAARPTNLLTTPIGTPTRGSTTRTATPSPSPRPRRSATPRRPARETGWQQQSCSSSTLTNTGRRRPRSRRQHDPDQGPDGARAGRVISPSRRQQRAAFPFIKDPSSSLAWRPTTRVGATRRGCGRPYPAGSLYAPASRCSPLSATQRDAGCRLQTTTTRSQRRRSKPDPAAGGAPRLSLLSSSCASPQVLGPRARKLVTPGAIAGYTDVLNPYPFITNYGVTVPNILDADDVHRRDLRVHPQPARGGASIGGTLTGGILVNDSANRLNGLANFPLLYPNAGVVDQRYYAYGVLNDLNPVWWDGTRINLPPASVGAPGCRARRRRRAAGTAEPGVPGFLTSTARRTGRQPDQGRRRHTIRRRYNNHSYRPRTPAPAASPTLASRAT